MRCIFCLEERPGSLEHIFPEAIGGSSTIDRVCSDCNSRRLGSPVDAPLIEAPPIVWKRWELGLKSKKGKVPDPINTILGDGVLATDPRQKLKVRINPETKKLDIELVYNRVDHGDGTYSISIDQRRMGEMPRIIQKMRADAGVPPFTDDELSKKISEILEHHTHTIGNPCVLHTTEMKNFERGILKIAYELAFIWIGENYLHTHTAHRLRDAILNNAPYPEIDIQCPCDPDAFWIWAEDENSHIAFTAAHEKVLIVCIRLFDRLSARVVVQTEDDPVRVAWPIAGRFLTNDPVNKVRRDTTFFDECGRITQMVLSGDAGMQAMVFERMRRANQ